MDVNSLPGAGRFSGRSKLITAAAVGVLGLAGYLTGSETLWNLAMQLAPTLIGAQ